MAKRKAPPKTPSTFEAAIKAFINLLGSGAYEKNNWEKFQDWCEAAYCAYAKLAALAMGQQERAEQLEARYMRVVNGYTDEDYLRTVWVGLRELGETTVEQGGGDYLGRIAGELNALDGDMGQFFTPYEVSRAMAQMMFESAAEEVARLGFIRVSEPACGAGSMVIAIADVLQEQQLDPMTAMLVEAWDLSHLAFLMTYLQLTWRGVTAKVVRGNTLSQEVFEVAWTPMIVVFFAVHQTLDQPRRNIQHVVRELITQERQGNEEAPAPSEAPEPEEVKVVAVPVVTGTATKQKRNTGKTEQLRLFD